MPIEFVCPSCRGTLRVTDESAGQMVRCGSCLATLRVPDPPLSPPADEPDPFPPRRAAAEPIAPPEPRSRTREPDEDFGEPRPGRRRPPPPSSGRSVLFWVMMALLLVGLLTAAACGGAFFLLQPKWRTHESAQGGFKVELPAEARADMEDMVRANAQIAQNVRVEGTLLIVKLEEYSVIYADIDPNLRQLRTDEHILDDAVAGIEDDGGAEVVRDDPATVNGFAARDVVFIDEEGGTYVCRIIVAGSRLYMLTAGGPNVDPAGNERTRRFLDSFEITDAKLIARQKQQRANEKLVEQGVKRALERARKGRQNQH